MSRIILSRYDTGEERIVVGWDHPCGGAFWQEFNKEPEPDPNTGQVSERNWNEWQEMKRYGGYMPGIPYDKFRTAVPEDIQPLITNQVMEILAAHASDPDSGRLRPIDLSEKVRKAHDEDIMEGIRRGNLMEE